MINVNLVTNVGFNINKKKHFNILRELKILSLFEREDRTPVLIDKFAYSII
jgi:hypothetical protein